MNYINTKSELYNLFVHPEGAAVPSRKTPAIMYRREVIDESIQNHVYAAVLGDAENYNTAMHIVQL